MGKILIGTSSWADRTLFSSGFYSHDLKTAGEKLGRYARSFPLTEMDSSFHFIPGGRNLSAWLEATPPGFLFDVKAFSLLTGHPTMLSAFPRDMRVEIEQASASSAGIYIHKLPENLIDAVWERFISSISPIVNARKLGLIIFQFPPWFHPDQKHYDYIMTCQKKVSPFQIGVEFRTGDWLNQDHRRQTIQFFTDNKMTLVTVDEPQGLKTSVPPVIESTSRSAAVRFHGRNVENWEKKGVTAEMRFNYLYTEAELGEWVPRIARLAEQAEAVHVIFKNKPADLAVQNALQMKSLLGLT